MNQLSKPAQNLQPAELPLYGRHLIEASAGTGKTFNITRLYLRCLLEKELTVQQILVMTFTKAATEELRARIDKELRNALNNWGKLGEKDTFFAAMEKQFSREQITPILKLALLDLDEAAIFTIHGFCNRVLSAQAFASGIDFETQMETDTSEYLLAATQDWIRKVNQNKDDFQLLAQNNWHIPEHFLSQFAVAISQADDTQAASESNSLSEQNPAKQQLTAATEDAIKTAQAASLQQAAQTFWGVKQSVLSELNLAKTEIFDALVNQHKDKTKREEEWAELIGWLENESDMPFPKSAGDFINGNRYRKNESLKTLFEPLKQLKDEFKKSLDAINQRAEQQLNNAPVCELVLSGILHIQQKFNRMKQQQSVMDFDDLIIKLSRTLLAEKEKKQTQNMQASLTESLKQDYPVALVDEFQDTDAAQYAILDCLYPNAAHSQNTCLIMIGDPKQAIYGFRGGDIFTYLAAREQADFHWIMDTNWRSVATMVSGYNRLFWGNALTENSADVFGYNIAYEQIKSTANAAANKAPLFDPNNQFAAVNYAFLGEVEQPTGAKGAVKADYTSHLATWCSNEIIRLLTQAKLGELPLKQQDIAILVKTGGEAQIMQTALAASGLASVYLSDRSNILLSEQALHIEQVLMALLEVENESLLIRAFSTPLFGYDLAQLARFQQTEYQEEWEAAVNLATELKQLWQYNGVMALLMHLIHHQFKPQAHIHERSLTNMIHLAEILQQASRQFKHPQQLLKWYKRQRELGKSEAEQRLESEANLIKIVTQHSSKGLEYPVVFIPFANIYTDPTKAGKQTRQFFKYFDQQAQQSRMQIGADDAVLAQVKQQGIAESVRLLYVALTRAEHRCYLGIAPFEQAEYSALAKTLGVENNDQWDEKIQNLVKTSQGSSQLIQLAPTIQPEQYQGDESAQNSIQPAQFNAELDDKWSLYSFSKITRNAHTSLSDKNDERRDLSQLAADELIDQVEPSSAGIQFTLPKGAHAGNLLHDILEHTDFSQPNWAQSTSDPIIRFGLLEDTQKPELFNWLDSLIHARFPVISEPDKSLCLADLSFKQTLREAEFYFPLNRAYLAALMKLLKQHRAVKHNIYLPAESELQGMMHGFIDLIFEYNGKFYVADYKSTHLGNRVEDYHFDALKANNQAHFYDLQYLIYSLALHRYLQTRLPDYDVNQHFGGVYYFYLRGMDKHNSEAFGVFYTEITAQVLTELDALFSQQKAEPSQSTGEQLELL
ncbi:exodeoxyribonuclease V subunit beta [Catenovulum sp. 2E275]|uniref:exodeoxyribonuclease V subunit beta n=1 Tax=Catenovulum sp. 2E275 TaxID=2980497 RepID=UPI0021D1C45C|nr:exodeoxyribonuclease V subunit beta [Catenovulum sp. 2E275]MCU4674601.1 exodeoxyribonuclease V subunit beta [Catenovulum sp. 2E275]